MDLPSFVGEWEFWVAGLSALAAWIAAAFAWSMHRATRRQLQLNLEADQRQRSNLALQVTESFSRREPEGQTRLYAFALSVTNPADAPNAVVEIELLVDYELDSGDLMTTVLRPRPLALPDAVPSLSPPVRLEARSSEAGWAFFAVDTEILHRYRVRGYRVVCRDTQDRMAEARSIIIREVIEPDGQEDQAD